MCSSSGGNKTESDQSWLNYSELDQNKFTFSLATFSLFSSLVTHPLNVLVTRAQAGVTSSSSSSSSTSSSGHTTNPNANASVTNEMFHSIKTIGVRGLFRGWAPIAIMGLPSNVVYLSITESSREFLQHKLKNIFPKLSPVYIDGIQSTASSLVSNGVSLIPFVPADVISARLIVQGKKDIGMIKMIQTIYKESGYKGFFKGYNVSLLFCAIYSTQWWWTYSVCRRECIKIERIADSPVVLDLIAGMVAGVVTTVCLHPIDTIKTKIMTGGYKSSSSSGVDSSSVSNSGSGNSGNSGSINSVSSSNSGVRAGAGNHAVSSSFIRVFADVIKKEGHAALWRGLTASMYQTAISSTGFAIVYELIKRFSVLEANSSTLAASRN